MKIRTPTFLLTHKLSIELKTCNNEKTETITKWEKHILENNHENK